MLLTRHAATLSIALAFGCAVPTSAQTASPASEQVVQTFPLFSSNNRTIVVARFNGSTPVPLVFDTGTNGNIVDSTYAKQVGLPNVGPSESVDGATGRPIPGYTTRLVGLTIGRIAVADGPATVIDFKTRDSVGVIGPNSFPGRLTEIDFAHGRVRILPDTAGSRPTGSAVGHLDELPAVTVQLPGQTITALVDTGNDQPLSLPLSMAASLPLKAPPVRNGTTRSAGGRQDSYVAQIVGEVRIGSVVLQSPMVSFEENGHPNVGMPVLKHMLIVVDHTGQRTWLSPLQ